MKHETFDCSLEVHLIFYAFPHHSTRLLRCLYQKPSSQPPVQALLHITCAGGIPRARSRTHQHHTQPLRPRSYKHFSETTAGSVCGLKSLCNSTTLHRAGQREVWSWKECIRPPPLGPQHPQRVLRAGKRGSLGPTGERRDIVTHLHLGTLSNASSPSHQLHCSCHITVSQTLM